MKKILFLFLIGFGAWNYFDQQPAADSGAASAPTGKIGVAEARPSASEVRQFNCDGRVYCSEMTSRAEAEYFSRYCPGTKMDGDRDGEPCENDSRF
jgi:hypothetical protein